MNRCFSPEYCKRYERFKYRRNYNETDFNWCDCGSVCGFGFFNDSYIRRNLTVFHRYMKYAGEDFSEGLNFKPDIHDIVDPCHAFRRYYNRNPQKQDGL